MPLVSAPRYQPGRTFVLALYKMWQNNRSLSRAWRSTLLNDVCVYCGAAPDGLDHIASASSGGADDWSNRAPACEKCDSSKGPTSLLWFLWARQRAAAVVARRTRYHDELHRASARRKLAELLCQQHNGGHHGHLRRPDRTPDEGLRRAVSG